MKLFHLWKYPVAVWFLFMILNIGALVLAREKPVDAFLLSVVVEGCFTIFLWSFYVNDRDFADILKIALDNAREKAKTEENLKKIQIARVVLLRHLLDGGAGILAHNNRPKQRFFSYRLLPGDKVIATEDRLEDDVYEKIDPQLIELFMLDEGANILESLELLLKPGQCIIAWHGRGYPADWWEPVARGEVVRMPSGMTYYLFTPQVLAHQSEVQNV